MPKLIIDGIIGWDISANFVRNFLDSNDGKDITVEISSPGGSVFTGINIYNMLKKHNGTVTTHIMSLAASMGSVIALAGDVRKAESISAFMIHNASAFSGGDHRDLRKTADIIESLSKLLAQIYVDITGKSKKEIKALMDEETFFFGSEIKEAGFVNEIINNDSNDDKNAMLINAQARIDNCITTMKESDRTKNDINKAAALLENDDFLNNHQDSNDSNNEIVDNDDAGLNNNIQNKQEDVIMTPEEIKAKFPEVYSQIFNSGVKSVQDNIEAHAEWFDVAPEAALEAIKKNEEFSAKHASKYAKAKLNVDDINNRQTDDQNLGDINIDQNDVQNKEKLALEAFEKSLTSGVE